MSRIVSRAESWERAYEAFQQINFAAFDFNTIKESMLDYIKLYFPEDFNDYIESSEFIAVLELFAYLAELYAYRLDINAHENFITVAQRKESILRLAKLVSYQASRNIPARGLVKLDSITTSETVIDSSGRNLAGRKIIWNDSNNFDWKEQFFLVMNRVLEQPFGTVAPNERVQVDDVLFELYSWSNNPLVANGKSVFAYSTTAAGESFPMELVPTTLTETGPEERRPESNSRFTILYGSDGLGDGSNNTGFLIYTKQGELQRRESTFDGLTPNQTYDLEINNINDTDVWLNNIDPDTKTILTADPNADLLPHLVSRGKRYGEWIEVDHANAQNIIFNTNDNRQKYEIETLDNDQVRIIFGDNEFADIPNGTFEFWYRTSTNADVVIPTSSIVNKSSSFTYPGANGNTYTLSFSYSLTSTLQNNSPSEDIEHIRRAAPSVYYTQDRMVNARDYNSFMLQDPTIQKLRAINRTYSGDSKYIPWHDPSGSYENVKIFGDDLALYWDEETPGNGGLIVVSTAVNATTLVNNTIEPLLSSTDFFAILAPIYEADDPPNDPRNIRRAFSTAESVAIVAALSIPAVTTVSIYYSYDNDEWTVGATYGDSIHMITVTANYSGATLSGWDVQYATKRLVAESQATQFWNTNDSNRVVTYDTLDVNGDVVNVLQANSNANGDGLLDSNRQYLVLGQELVEQNLPNAGLRSIHKLSVMTEDVNADGTPDNLLQPVVLNYDVTMTHQQYIDKGLSAGSPNSIITLDQGRSWVSGYESTDISVYRNDTLLTYGNATTGWTAPTGIIQTEINFGTSIVLDPADTIRVVLTDYVYFNRESSSDPWLPITTTASVQQAWAINVTVVDEDDLRYRRLEGRYPFNFSWFHFTDQFKLIDPSVTNIIDLFIITRGYYTALTRWLTNKTDVKPTLPTSLDLRTTYAGLLENRMISDTVILHPGTFKILFGSRADPSLRATFKVIRPAASEQTITNNEAKVKIVNTIRRFFNIDLWEFGETFYFTELAAVIHQDLGTDINSVVLVPTSAQNQFGDMFEVQSVEDQLFEVDISTSDIEIVESYTSDNIRQNDPS